MNIFDKDFYLKINPPCEEITKLRKLSFLAYYQKNVDLNGLEWNLTDRKSLHICAYLKTKLIASIRVSVFSNRNKFELVTQIPLNPNITVAPYVLLSRAATIPEYSGIGLHSILRLHALKVCQNSGFSTVYGSLEQRSLRLKQLLDLGYEIDNSLPNWPRSYLKNIGNVVLIKLDGKEKLQRAICLLEKRSKFSSKNNLIAIDTSSWID